MASTWPGNDQQKIARDAGAVDYLVKPFRADALRSAIEAIGL
jgi:DNA-binding response OmpR family regulator